MAYKTQLGKYECSYCLKQYNTYVEADSCRSKHELLYLPLTIEDLNRLSHLIYSDVSRNIVSESLIEAITRLQRRALLGKMEYDE